MIDVNGYNITEPFVTGKLVYEGTNVTLGYAECGDDLINGDESGGILQTGDMAHLMMMMILLSVARSVSYGKCSFRRNLKAAFLCYSLQ